MCVYMFTAETLLSASLKRLKQTVQIRRLCKNGVVFQEYKFNGSPEHFLKRCEDSSIRKKYNPVCELLATRFYDLSLPQEKAFLLNGTHQHFQPMFKNTNFPQPLHCDDEVLVWDIKELKDLYDFYKNNHLIM